MKAAAKTAAKGRGAAAAGGAQPAQAKAREPNARPPDMLKSGVKLEELTGEGLRIYAKSAGVPGHVINSLSEDKLKRECLLRVQAYLDEL